MTPDVMCFILLSSEDLSKPQRLALAHICGFGCPDGTLTDKRAKLHLKRINTSEVFLNSVGFHMFIPSLNFIVCIMYRIINITACWSFL